jgi:hypothetical protein
MLSPVRASTRALACSLFLVASSACGACSRGGDGAQSGGPGESPATPSATCPERAKAPALPLGTRPEQAELTYWLARYTPAELDEPLLTEGDVVVYDRAIGRSGDALYSQRDLLLPLDPVRLRGDVVERLRYLRERLADGRYVDGAGKPLPPAAQQAFDADALSKAGAPVLRVALDVVPIRCGPLAAPLYEHKAGAALNRTYDRNACSSAHAQGVVQVLADWPGGMRLVRTRYALGWIDAAAPLSPPIPAALADAFVRGTRMRAPRALELSDAQGARYAVTKHTTLPLLPNGQVSVADAEGFHTVAASGLEPTRRPLTRRALLTTAFTFMDSPYGFGDTGGGRDCSRLQMDVFESFDIALPRHSAWQALAGNFTVDVAGLDDNEKLRMLDEAQKSGAVLLAFPGHIMLYLGKNTAGAPMVLHALGEYVQPCANGKGETVLDVQRTVVSDLSLGAGTSRHSLLARVTALVVLGKPPAPALAARADVHPLPPHEPPGTRAACEDSDDARIFVSPARARGDQPLTLIATSDRAITSPALWVYDAAGDLVESAPHRLNGPPHSLWRRIDRPSSGRYTALFMDGARVLGCKRITLHDGALAEKPASTGPIWKPRRAWDRGTLNLWSAFVEQLFDGPPDDEQTWTSLHALLRDPARNILYNHFGLNEDAAIDLVPDCADLPYSLRAYFSWKLGLPFGFRQCSRGKPGVPPSCGPLITNLSERDAAGSDDVTAFATFVNRRVRAGVHSATGRTRPDDPETDLYPVDLQRASLPPGTPYADPYGHIMISAKWFPQGRDPNDYGILIAAEAQPDGTVGRRRFFPGSFLFDPSTKDAGAGWKAFRPLTFDARNGEITALDNEALTRSDLFARFSMAQYQGTKDDFYERMDRLINPAPLDAHVRLKSLIDAMEESVKRRVLSIDNAEAYWASGNRGPIAMPVGYEIFETEGAWEDFATPSRDMRLLIALDTVLAVPGQVEKYPERFKIASAAEAKQRAAELRAEIDRDLAARTFRYTKSDGTAQTLTLKDVLVRAAALETAYNPNDCVELRWGAEAGTPEAESCRRHAPPEQRARMERYRAWFHARTRPPRGTAS